MTRVGRSVSIRSLALLGLVSLAAVFVAAGQGSATQSGCTRTITRADEVHAALAAASPGDTLCFSGVDLAGAALMMTRSGTADAPIRLVSDGQTNVHEVQVIADYVLIQGFTIVGGGELLLAGTGINAQKNMVRDTQRGGIVCASCIDSTIESNTVHHVATTGISLSGQRITVRSNHVSATVAGDDGSANGVRFFGNGHRIISNTIQDISVNEYPTFPQVACFETFDTGRPPTFDVVILGNACQNVDGLCLIATGDESGNSDAPAGSRSITFTGNACAVNGDQAVGLRRWPNVDMHKNKLFGPNFKRAILISDGSTGCSVKSNTTPDDVAAVEIDDSSRPGFHDQDKNPF
ncbi:MAG: right-handed parallel beta-helix repeat-containing protein [Actinomycetota bacterium]|nr:right-handed parallel beta-helix repeat-containing protein [Actinomycetota bacterium]